MINSTYRLVFVSAALCLASCSSTYKNQNNQTQTIDVKNTNRTSIDQDTVRRSKALHHFLIGEMSFAKDDYAKALKNFNMASRLMQSTPPILHAKLAQLRLRQGDLDQAMQEAKNALVSKPNDEATLILYAGILESLGKKHEAVDAYKKVININPERVDAYLMLSGIYAQLGNYKAALETTNNLISRNPALPIAFQYQTRVYESQGNNPRALQAIEKATKLDPDNTSISIDHIRILVRQKKISQAKAICSKILEKNPDNVDIRRILGHLLIGESKFDEALEHLKFIEAKEEDPSETRYRIALINLDRKNIEEAEKQLQLVLTQKPDHGYALYYLGSITASENRTKEAIEYLVRVPNTHEAFVKSRLFASFLLKKENNNQKAAKLLIEVLNQYPAELQALTTLAAISKDLNDFSIVKGPLENAAANANKNDNLLFGIGIIYDDLDKKNEASDLMRHVVSINPKQSDALNYLAYIETEKEQGDLKLARQLITKAIKIKPKDGYYLDTLGWLEYRLKEYKQSLTTFEKVMSIIQDDPVILSHYAEVLIANQKPDLALGIYEKIQTKLENYKGNLPSGFSSIVEDKIKQLKKE